MKQKAYDAIIVGGGLTGLLTAYALSKKGLNIGSSSPSFSSSRSSVSSEYLSEFKGVVSLSSKLKC